tara:strand:- start:132 stop:539 length:408 start_codon:yes stop_codon:yes gene_type:complete
MKTYPFKKYSGHQIIPLFGTPCVRKVPNNTTQQHKALTCPLSNTKRYIHLSATLGIDSPSQQRKVLDLPFTNAKRWIFLENLSVFLDRMADDSHSGRMHRGNWLPRGNGMFAIYMGFGEREQKPSQTGFARQIPL